MFLVSYDFAMDSTEDGRRLKVMPVVDEYTRECLSLESQRSIKAEDVINTLYAGCSSSEVSQTTFARITGLSSSQKRSQGMALAVCGG